jgi:hypothetical protein
MTIFGRVVRWLRGRPVWAGNRYDPRDKELARRRDGGGTQLRRYLNLGRYNICTLSAILLGVATQLFVDGILGFRPRLSTGIVPLLGYYVSSISV